MIVAGQRLVLDLRMVTDEHDGLSTTRVGREVERAIEALARPRSPSPIVFVDRSRSTPLSPSPSPRDASREPTGLRALVAMGDGLRRDGRKGGDVVLELTALTGGVGSDRTVCV